MSFSINPSQLFWQSDYLDASDDVSSSVSPVELAAMEAFDAMKKDAEENRKHLFTPAYDLSVISEMEVEGEKASRTTGLRKTSTKWPRTNRSVQRHTEYTTELQREKSQIEKECCRLLDIRNEPGLGRRPSRMVQVARKMKELMHKLHGMTSPEEASHGIPSNPAKRRVFARAISDKEKRQQSAKNHRVNRNAAIDECFRYVKQSGFPLGRGQYYEIEKLKIICKFIPTLTSQVQSLSDRNKALRD